MPNPKKDVSVLFLASQMATGGAQNVLFSQAGWFSEQGYRCIIVFFYDREGLHHKWQSTSPVPVINLEAWTKEKSIVNGFRLLRALGRLYRLLLEEKFSVIETFTHHANILGLPLAWAAKVPVRLASHHGLVENFPPFLESIHSWIINQNITTNMVVVSQRVMKQAIEDEGIDPDKITVIPNGIDLPMTTELGWNDQLSLRQSLKVKPEANMLLTVGRLSTSKGHVYLLDAIPKVLRVFPNTVFVIAGGGPLLRDLEKKAYEIGIAEYVRFLGFRTDIANLLSIADAFVLPSIWEGLPIALLEAMGSGLPVIATKVAGVDEVIIDTHNGLLVPPADPNALSDAIIQLLSDNRLRERLGSAGEVLVKEKYTVEKMCRKYEALFRAEQEAKI